MIMMMKIWMKRRTFLIRDEQIIQEIDRVHRSLKKVLDGIRVMLQQIILRSVMIVVITVTARYNEYALTMSFLKTTPVGDSPKIVEEDQVRKLMKVNYFKK